MAVIAAIEVNPGGGYDRTGTPADAAIIRAQQAVHRRAGLVIESSNPKVAGWDAVVGGYVDYLFELSAIR